MAMEQDRLAGIISLEKGYYIDFLYVHPDFGRQGIARALLNAIITHADQGWLEVFASKLARPFFENHGFEVVHDNKVHLDGQVLINYKMVKEPI